MMKKLFAVLLFSLILAACGGEENTTEKVQEEENQQKQVPQSEVSWGDQIKQIASSNKSETEKHDEVMNLAGTYTPTEDEIHEFEEYIISEFENGNYLRDITNHEYMLTNLFKSGVVEDYYEDAEQNPIDSFAFDFLQNTKYTYRGVDAVDSESVKSNEDQMNKALQDIK